LTLSSKNKPIEKSIEFLLILKVKHRGRVNKRGKLYDWAKIYDCSVYATGKT
jgi:hypothetical protein